MARPISLYDLAFPWGPNRINRNLYSDETNVRYVLRWQVSVKKALLSQGEEAKDTADNFTWWEQGPQSNLLVL